MYMHEPLYRPACQEQVPTQQVDSTTAGTTFYEGANMHIFTTNQFYQYYYFKKIRISEKYGGAT